VISSSLNNSVCFDFLSCFWFLVLVGCLFDSGWKINFEQVQIWSMTRTLASSTLQIQRHEYSGDMNIVILVLFVGICILPFYAINMDVVSLFIDSSFLFLANLDLYCIDVLYQFEWMEYLLFLSKKKIVENIVGKVAFKSDIYFLKCLLYSQIWVPQAHTLESDLPLI
jgi:hypothetical protein